MTRFAPWWAYLIPFLALNYARQLLVGSEGFAVDLALAAAIAGAVFVATTAIHRSRLPA